MTFSNFNNRPNAFAFLALVALSLSSCGGGGSDRPPPEIGIQVAPVAQMSVSTFEGKLNQTITVSGEQSFDVNQDPITFAWRLQKPDDSNAQLSGSGDEVSFVPDVTGFYQVEITVNDGQLSTTLLSEDIGISPIFVNDDCSAHGLYLSADSYEFIGCKDVYFRPPLFLDYGSVLTNNAGHAVAVWYDNLTLLASFYDGTDWSGVISVAQFSINRPSGPLIVRFSENDVTAIAYDGIYYPNGEPRRVLLAYLERDQLRQSFEVPYERAEVQNTAGVSSLNKEFSRLIIDTAGIAHVMVDTTVRAGNNQEYFWNLVSFGPGGITNQQSFVHPDSLFTGPGGLDANSNGEIVALQASRLGESQLSRLVNGTWTTPVTLPNLADMSAFRNFYLIHMDDGSIHLIYGHNNKHWAIIDHNGDRMIERPKFYVENASFSFDRQNSRIIMYYRSCPPGIDADASCPTGGLSYYVNDYTNGVWGEPVEVPDSNNIALSSYYVGNNKVLLVGDLKIPRPFRVFNLVTREVSPVHVINLPSGNTVLGFDVNEDGLMTVGSTVNLGDSLILYTLRLDLSGQ